MKRQEAYSIFNLSPDASQEEVKQKYRELSKKYHPDVSKEPDASEKFKKINEAYSRIKEQNFEQELPQGFEGFNPFSGIGINIEDIFGGSGSGNYKMVNRPPIELSTVISFKDSVFGCKKTLSFDRIIKCEICDGSGGKKNHNGCSQCNGMGKVTSRRGNMIFTSTCSKCNGKTNVTPCNNCNSNGYLESNTSISINVPAGIINNNTLRLGNIGHFMGASPFGDRHADVYVHVHVVQDPEFYLEGQDVVKEISISMIEAITGTNKKVITLDGESDIEVKPLTKNKDEIKLPNLGVARKGNQIVRINVNYPANTDKLVSLLKELE